MTTHVQIRKYKEDTSSRAGSTKPCGRPQIRRKLQRLVWSSLIPPPPRRIDAGHHRWRPEETRKNGIPGDEGSLCTHALVSRNIHQLRRTRSNPEISIGRRQRPYWPRSPSSFTTGPGDDATPSCRRRTGPSTACQIQRQQKLAAPLGETPNKRHQILTRS
jgi:hypothetical protein